MISKGEVEEVLQKHFGSLVDGERIRQAAEAVAALETEWEALDVPLEEMGFTQSVNCPDICFLADQVYKGETVRLFRRRKALSTGV